MILLIDNYDSFAQNLARYLVRLGQTVQVSRNDAITVAQVQALRPSLIVLSPGPCTPREAGISLQLVQELHTTVPIFGVCLGHQTIAVALGGELQRSEPVHGRASLIHHDGQGIFADLPQPLAVGRYHSLSVNPASLAPPLDVSARTSCGLVMAMRHRVHPLVGVQFHPESVLTQHGYDMLRALLRGNGMAAAPQPKRSDELIERREQPLPETPQIPITF